MVGGRKLEKKIFLCLHVFTCRVMLKIAQNRKEKEREVQSQEEKKRRKEDKTPRIVKNKINQTPKIKET